MIPVYWRSVSWTGNCNVLQNIRQYRRKCAHLDSSNQTSSCIDTSLAYWHTSNWMCTCVILENTHQYRRKCAHLDSSNQTSSCNGMSLAYWHTSNWMGTCVILENTHQYRRKCAHLDSSNQTSSCIDRSPQSFDKLIVPGKHWAYQRTRSRLCMLVDEHLMDLHTIHCCICISSFQPC